MIQLNGSDAEDTVEGLVDGIIMLDERIPNQANSSSNQQTNSIRNQRTLSFEISEPSQQQDQINPNQRNPFDLSIEEQKTLQFDWVRQEEFQLDSGNDFKWNINDHIEKHLLPSRVIQEETFSHQTEMKSEPLLQLIHSKVEQFTQNICIAQSLMMDYNDKSKITKRPLLRESKKSNNQNKSQFAPQIQAEFIKPDNTPVRQHRNIFFNQFMKRNQNRLLAYRSLAPQVDSEEEKPRVESKKLTTQCFPKCQKKNCSKCKKFKKPTGKKQGCKADNLKKINKKRKESSSDEEGYFDKGYGGRVKYSQISFSGLN